MTLDPNLDLQLATEYVGGITLPVPSQIGNYARVDPTGINLEYVPLDTPTIYKDTTLANGAFVAGTRAAPNRYKLRGNIVVAEIVDLPSFVSIDAEGANITTTLAPGVGLADDWNNTLFRATTALSALTATTTENGEPGQTKFVIANTAGFVAGDWIQVYSYNVTNQPLGYITQEDIPVWRLYKIASVTATDINIIGVIIYWQASGSTVTKVSSLIEGITWKGGRFDCSGGTIANGVTFNGVAGFTVDSACFKGFSRAGIEMKSGATGFLLNAISHEGECNSVIYGQTAEGGKITNFSSPAYADATKHANGIPRGLITLRRRAQNIQITNAYCAWGTTGIQMWAVQDCTISDYVFENLNGNNRLAGVDGSQTTKCGIGIDQGQTSVTPLYPNGVDGQGAVDGAAFSYNVHIQNVNGGLCLGIAATQCLFYFHDTVGELVANVTLTNYGRGDAGGGLALKTIILSDCFSSTLTNVRTSGTYGCIYTENAGMVNGTIDGINHLATPGASVSNGFLLNLDHAEIGGQFTVRNVKIGNGDLLWTFGPSFADSTMTVQNMQVENWPQACELLLCVVNAGIRPLVDGLILQLTGARGGAGNKFGVVNVPAAGSQGKCVATTSGLAIYFEFNQNGGYGFVQVLEAGKRSVVQAANAVGTGPALLQGDLMRHAAAGDGGIGYARGDNTTIFNHVLGKVTGPIPGVGLQGRVKLI